MKINRRYLLIAATLAAGGYVVGCSTDRQQLRNTRLPLAKGQIALNGWIKLGTDGIVTVVLSKAEMGQGIHTGLMMLVAEELDCAWDQIRTENAPIDKLYGNIAAMADGVPFRPDDQGPVARSMRWVVSGMMGQMGIMMTGGSSSTKDLWLPMREAAAVTRATLVQAVAQQWSVPASQISLQQGVFKGPAGQTATFANAVQWLGADPKPAEQFTLKTHADFQLIGKPMPRNDSAAKVDGSAMFGLDVKLPGMLHAAITMSPVLGGTVNTVDDTQAHAMPGVKGVLILPAAHGSSGGVAVVAEQYWQARKALQALKITYNDGPMAIMSSSDVQAQLAKAVKEDDGFGFWKAGDVQKALSGATTQLESQYSAPYLAHATMEPMNCTVLFDGNKATVWVPTQVPGLARQAAAKALGLKDEQVEMQLTYLGGGFGRRLEVDVVAQAATVAKSFRGRPVQLLWSREEDTQHDFYRPACVSRFEAGLDAQGRIAAWRNVSAGQAITPNFLPRNVGMPGMGPDKTTSEGSYDVAYEFPNVRVGHVTVDLPVPVGYWRSVGHSHQAFFKESFVDECAHAAKADSLTYRLDLLTQHPRQKAVLQLAASKAGWGQPLSPAPDGARKARGIALHESFGSVVAQVAEVSVDAQGAIRVHRVVCAIDCGMAVNPNTIAQQVESSVAYGLSAALYGRIDIEQGRVKQSNFHDYPALRMAECPVVETHIVASTAHPEGVGEPALPPIAPAVANAVFVLTGKRLRSLPLQLNV
ncbi:xanthine dehydrogenase family protein molybdopterin-binding subunit [Limnohabitans radicicola]|uniref:Xanthine dehydrogenase family protein molybdopterin-binding subunit n=1 Tax=Limnohabitans radicicola TaxID=2771427 RepID=A0A927FIC4_9BURK|nr:xanthine dehydrogenase family protein molybdopterin-binding subunit [Limnohabitans radicicola]MBD8051138.1 xanthine dehydrogenase family protein molybdopterin-binding subunit [Limnohabitans radicicola]